MSMPPTMTPPSDFPTISPEILAKRRDNASTRLCALASELIGRILLHARDMRLEPSLSSGLPGDWMGWLPAAHICHHIRAIALAFPLLWDHIRVRRRDASMAFLERSGAALIYLRVDSRAKVSMVKEVLEQLPRIRSLVLGKSKLFKSPEDVSWLSPSAPHLVSLDISQRDGYDPQYISILELMLSRHMPLLRSLDVGNHGWRWMDNGHPLPTTLTHLSVSKAFPWMYEKTLARKALSVLSSLSRLESLCICDLVLLGNPGDPQFTESATTTKVSLPKLQSLTCDGGVLPSLRLLECLAIPSTCKICVKATFTDYDFSHLPMLVSLFNKNICATGAGLSPFIELCISIWQPGHGPLCVRAFRTKRPLGPQPVDGTSSGAEFVLKCYMAENEQEFDWSHMMYNIVGAVDLSSVRTLELPGLSCVRRLDYRHVLRHMAAIETICFGEGWTQFEFLRVLLTFCRNSDSDSNAESQVFLPRLHQLVFSHVEFDRSSTASYAGPFIKWLQERRERGAGITTIVLRSCETITPELTAMIRREVGEVREETSSWEQHRLMNLERFGYLD